MKFFKSEKFKKFIFGICSFILIFCMFSVNVFAATTNDQIFEENSNTENHFSNGGGISFNVWKLYRNSLTFALYSDGGDLKNTVPVYTNDNVIVKDINGVTTISNDNSYLFATGSLNYITAFSLSVPTTRLEPVFYVNRDFVGMEVRFNVSFTFKFIQVPVDRPDKLLWIRENPATPIFDLYFGVDKDSYSSHYCKVLSTTCESFSEDSVTYSYILSTSFDKEGYIVGFWSKFYWKDWGIWMTNDNDHIGTLTWTLSPISFLYYDDEIGVFFDSENSMWTQANDYFARGQTKSLNAIFGNQNLRGATLWLSRNLEAFYNNNPWLKLIIDFSLALGLLTVILGLASTAATNFRKENR